MREVPRISRILLLFVQFIYNKRKARGSIPCTSKTILGFLAPKTHQIKLIQEGMEVALFYI